MQTVIDLDYENPIFDMMLLTDCVICNQRHSVLVHHRDLDEYVDGALVQEAFPYLSPADRELHFITHICGDCFANEYGEDV